MLPKPYFQDAAVTIYHADCRQVVPFLPRFDLLLTDPPYGIGVSGGVGLYGRQKWAATDSKWDAAPPAGWLLEMLLESAESHVIWGGNYYSLPPSRQYLIWDKGAGFRGRNFAECELAWCSQDGNAKVYNRDPLASGDYKGKEHPTAKPVALMTWCLELYPEAKTVLDPFGGSGSTARACKDLGRNCVLIEREERYCEVAAKRMGQEVLNLGAA